MTESMKIYYYNSGWVQISAIVEYPNPTTRVNQVGNCIVTLRDFEGALYSSWEPRDFTKMKVEDASSNIMFIGYLIDKEFTQDKLTLILKGFSAILEWAPFKKNYVLAEGKIESVPSNVGLPMESEDTDVMPNEDVSVSWEKWGTVTYHYEAVDDTEGNYYIYATDGNENAVDEFNCTTISIISATQIIIKIEGWTNASKDIEVDFYNGDSWEGYKAVGLTGTVETQSITFSGLNMNQTDLNNCKIRVKANSAYGADDYSYVKSIRTTLSYSGSDPTSLGLETNEDASFTWENDQWINDRDVGILILDNTSGNSIRGGEPSAVTPNGHTAASGNAQSIGYPDDADYYSATDTYAGGYNAYADVDMDGFSIADSNTLLKIELKYKIGVYSSYQGGANTGVNVYLKIKKDSSYITIATATAWYPIGVDGKTRWVEGTHEITTDLADYLDKTGSYYDALKGTRVEMESGATYVSGSAKLYIDYLEVFITYNQDPISPIMVPITDNGASWIKASSINWNDSGVDVGDKFQIGESTIKVLSEIGSACGIVITCQSTLTKYMARYFRGSYGMEGLKAVCLLEGMIWFEDHENEVIVVSKEADLVDSGIDLTQADYDINWKYNDHCNNFKKIEVYGNSELEIYASAIDESINSEQVKQLIDDTIMTNADAQEVANAQLAIWKNKRPSIYLRLHGMRSALMAGKLVDITLTRPTKAKAAYPIRRLERFREGEHVKTVIYAGLGSTPPDEEMADKIRKVAYLSHKVMTDRLQV